ncbi:unnamed protein product, partial [Polarella glacialis]
VDFSKSGTVSFLQFLRLMRMHREAELRISMEAFQRFCQGRKTLPANLVPKALAEMGFTGSMAGRKVDDAQVDQAMADEAETDDDAASLAASSIEAALACSSTVDALRSAIYSQEDQAQVEEAKAKAPASLEESTAAVQDKGSLDFEQFSDLADTCRLEKVARRRHSAGFSDAQLEAFHERFT